MADARTLPGGMTRQRYEEIVAEEARGVVECFVGHSPWTWLGIGLLHIRDERLYRGPRPEDTEEAAVRRMVRLQAFEAVMEEGRSVRAPRARPRKDGHVYFLQASNGAIKIGWATSVPARSDVIQSWEPAPLLLLATTPGTRRTEKDLHRVFAHARTHGEWFQPIPELLAHIEGLAS